MSASYPFFSIAKENNVPLAVVYAVLDELEREGSLELWALREMENISTPRHGAKVVVAKAALAERDRRAEVGLGTTQPLKIRGFAFNPSR